MKDENAYPMRINKYLAQKQICSRREADKIISEGKVLVNGKKAKLGDKIHENDKVTLDRMFRKKHIYLAYNKPVGIITHNPQGEEVSIQDIFKYKERVFPMGRLDKDSWGLILLTNDGRITGKLLDPENNHEKEYVVQVDKPINKQFLHQMSSGVKLDDGYVTKKCELKRRNLNSFSIILTEGKKRQIRRMCSALGYKVTDLKRIRIINIKLEGLQEGEFRKLKGKEREEFLSNIGMSAL